jgi:RND family efflux transporter MFP subunit
MAERDLARLLRQVRRTAAEAEPSISDAQLLERFALSRDEAAFELLVWRHRRLVFSVCWRVLSNYHDAEDAFQATFLALARRAGSIGKRRALAAWLHKVAYHAALTARLRRARALVREQPMRPADEFAAAMSPVSSLERKDLSAIIDAEISRLPEKFRMAIVLCYLQGKTVDEASRQLGCPRGTLASRLARARDKLRTRLARRGLVLSAGAVTLVLADGSLSAATPESLITATVGNALAYVTGQAASLPAASLKVTALAEEVLRAMFFKKVVTGAVMLVLLASLLLVGAGLNARLQALAASASPPIASADEPLIPVDAQDKLPPKKALEVSAPPRTVTVSRPVQRTFTPYEDFTGRLDISQNVHVRAPFGGHLQRICFTPGAEVKRGDLLFVFDPTEFEAAVAKAKEELATAEDRYKLANSKLQKVRDGIDQGVLPEAALYGAMDQVATGQKERSARQQALARAKRDLEATSVRAPVAGQVNATPYTANQDVAQDADLTFITPRNAIGVRFEMDERSYLRYQRLRAKHQVSGVGSPLQLGLADEDAFPHEGTLEYFDNRFDPSTGTIAVRGIIPNPDPLLLPGMFARVRMPFGQPRLALEINEDAIIPGQPKRHVWVVNDQGLVEQRPVRIGQLDGDLRVIEEGVTAKEWIVIDSASRLNPGDKVEAQRPKPQRESKR